MWPRVRDILLQNLGLKIASLVLALLLYAHVVTDQQREQRIPIPVALVGLPDTLAVLGRAPETVDVTVRGKWRDLIRLGLTRPRLSIDLGTATPGPFLKVITREDVLERAIPAELTKVVMVTEIGEPRTLDLAIEPKAAKRVPLRARLVGQPPPGYVAEEGADVDPDSARIEGAVSLVARTDTLFTLPVDIAGERERIQRQVPLDLGPEPLTVDPRRCLVTVRIARADSTGP